jgi:hypothetical protein
MQVEKRSMNWFPRESSWDIAEAQREKRKANSEAYMATNDALASAFQTSRDDLVYGMAEITAQMAAARVSKKA